MFRRLAAAVLAALYGAIALAGPELHDLLGCDYNETCGALAIAGDDGHTSPGMALGFRSVGHDDENCPVCKLLSMPRAALAAAADLPRATTTFERIVVFRDPIVAASCAPFLIRGPPAVS
jgi:hypothetical protein